MLCGLTAAHELVFPWMPSVTAVGEVGRPDSCCWDLLPQSSHERQEEVGRDVEMLLDTIYPLVTLDSVLCPSPSLLRALLPRIHAGLLGMLPMSGLCGGISVLLPLYGTLAARQPPPPQHSVGSGNLGCQHGHNLTVLSWC